MRLPSKPYSTLPIYSLGPVAAAKEEAGGASASAEPEKNPFGSGHSRHSLRRSMRYVSEELLFLLNNAQNAVQMPRFVMRVVHDLSPSSGFLSTAVKMVSQRTSRTCPRSSPRTGSPWRSA